VYLARWVNSEHLDLVMRQKFCLFLFPLVISPCHSSFIPFHLPLVILWLSLLSSLKVYLVLEALCRLWDGTDLASAL
jgi:hypothetical protein